MRCTNKLNGWTNEYNSNKMFVLNSQFTSVTTAAAAATAEMAATTLAQNTDAHIRHEWKRLMLYAIHLHSHWAIIIDSAEANKVWFDVLSGLCSIFFLFTLQWCEAFLFFLHTIHIIAYTLISCRSVCARVCVGVWAQKLYLGNHSEKAWTSASALKRINDRRLFDKPSSDRSSKSAPQKNSIMLLSFCRVLILLLLLLLLLNEVKMRKSIVHAKTSRKWPKKRKGKAARKRGKERRGDWKKLESVCMCVFVYVVWMWKRRKGNNARLLSRLGCRFTSLFFGLFRII